MLFGGEAEQSNPSRRLLWWLEDAEKGKIGRLIDWPRDGASGHVTVSPFGDSEVTGKIFLMFISIRDDFLMVFSKVPRLYRCYNTRKQYTQALYWKNILHPI